MILKLLQIAGALLMAAGVAAFALKAETRTMAQLLLYGGLLYGGARIVAWLKKKPD